MRYDADHQHLGLLELMVLNKCNCMTTATSFQSVSLQCEFELDVAIQGLPRRHVMLVLRIFIE